MDRIYLDHHATTPTDPRVLEAMLPYFTERFGNSASVNHAFGWEAQEAVDRARVQIARLIHADESEILFTSGATESNNLAIKGVLASKGNHIVTIATEHRSVLDTCRALERNGAARVTYVPVDHDGLVDPEDVRRAITDATVLVSVLFANNEIGVIQEIQKIGAICRERGVYFHTDVTQAIGKISVDVESMNIDLASFSAHKIYGPKGVGALYVRKRRPRVRLTPIIDGGGHERGLRSGTLPVPLIVGFGRASEICEREMPEESRRLLLLRERLRAKIFEEIPFVTLNGDPTKRLPGNLNVSFAYVEGESLLKEMSDVAVSLGSACSGASPEPSHVLKALGVGEDLIASSIRFGLGRSTTEQEIDTTFRLLEQGVGRLRSASPVYGNKN